MPASLRDPDELADALARIGSDPSSGRGWRRQRTELVERLFGPRDGRAPERVVRGPGKRAR